MMIQHHFTSVCVWKQADMKVRDRDMDVLEEEYPKPFASVN